MKRKLCGIIFRTTLFIFTCGITLADISVTGDVSPVDPASWGSTDEFIIGYYYYGALQITEGDAVSNSYNCKVDIGYLISSTGDVTVSGSGSTWTSEGFFTVGSSGDGTLNITNGAAVSSYYSNIGFFISSTGEVIVSDSGSTWTTRSLTVGSQGRGKLTITDGAAVNINSFNDSSIGDRSNSTGEVIVSGSGSTWISNFAPLYVGSWGNGLLNITEGGAVSNRSCNIGRYSGGTGTVTISGAGSTWINDGRLTVGDSGNGTLNITDGALVTADLVYMGYDLDGEGAIEMSTGGQLALLGDMDESIDEFLEAITFGDGDAVFEILSASGDWLSIYEAQMGVDYGLMYYETGDLTGYTVLTAIPENVEPIADAGEDIVAYAWIDGVAEVMLDGTGSYDIDGDELDYFWYNDANELIATGAEPNVLFGVGKYEVTLVVNDGIVDSEPNSSIVTIIEAIETKAKLTPKSLNRKSNRPHVTGKLTLMGSNEKDIDLNESLVLMPGNIEAEQVKMLPGKKREDSTTLMGYFDNATFMEAIEEDGDIEVFIATKLLSGQWVYGTDTVKVK